MVNDKNRIMDLVQKFAVEVAAQTDAIWNGNPKQGNRHSKRSWNAFQRLCTFGDEGRDALVSLFGHDRPDVRVSAAALLLRYRTAEALAVLQDAAKGKSLVAFEASECLKRWEEGTWALESEPQQPESPK